MGNESPAQGAGATAASSAGPAQGAGVSIHPAGRQTCAAASAGSSAAFDEGTSWTIEETIWVRGALSQGRSASDAFGILPGKLIDKYYTTFWNVFWINENIIDILILNCFSGSYWFGLWHRAR